MSKKIVTVIDYGAGNVRSVINAVEFLGWEVQMAATKEEIEAAERIIFPGVGSFGSAMERLNELGFVDPIRSFIKSGRPFFGVCLGMQTLFASSEESPGVEGLGIIPSGITRFAVGKEFAVPHVGWNGVNLWKELPTQLVAPEAKFYFVHSFVADAGTTPKEWILTTTDYGGQTVVSSVQKGNVFATQFHPEKSSAKGLELIKAFLEMEVPATEVSTWGKVEQPPTVLAKRVIACMFFFVLKRFNLFLDRFSRVGLFLLPFYPSSYVTHFLPPTPLSGLDVRANDNGDIVVTKGDQYEVREEGKGEVRNLGKPVELAERYYREGADEITFLNITSFRSSPLGDQPMLEVLRQASRRIFVPLCVGGGIRAFTDPNGVDHSALDVAGEYFRSGADKVSLGSDAVEAARTYLSSPTTFDKSTCSISTISHRYGAQAVVISVDPKRCYEKNSIEGKTFKALKAGPNGEEDCWYQCTAKGGREVTDLSARDLAVVCEKLGAGEVLLNCIDHDGCNQGFETALINDVKTHVGIPVIASSGAGKAAHFPEVFAKAQPDAALAAGIFHRKEVTIRVC